MPKLIQALAIAASAGLVLSACAQTTPVSYITPTEQPTPAATPLPLAAPVTISLKAEAGSGQSGTAKLEDLGNGKTKVTITLTGKVTPTPEPAHFHVGTCAKPGTVIYPLSNVVNGKSETTVDATIADITTKTSIVNVHKSVTQQGIYIACGEWTSPAAATMAPTAKPAATVKPAATPSAPTGY